jgi:transcriptional regulator with XRE-family HTH domain
LAEVADLVGTSPATVSCLEREVTNIPPLAKVRFARRLGVAVGTIIPVDRNEDLAAIG